MEYLSKSFLLGSFVLRVCASKHLRKEQLDSQIIRCAGITISDTKLRTLENKLQKLLKPKEDSLRIYHICENCLFKSKVLCDENPPFLPKESLIL